MTRTRLALLLSLVCGADRAFSASVTPRSTHQPTRAAEDCSPYNPDSLFIEAYGADAWMVAERIGRADHYSQMQMLDSKADAELALGFMKGHTQVCFIGRNNRRPVQTRSRYVLTYWKP